MMFRKNLSILALGAMLAATSFAARAQDKAAAFDIVGLRLGMTVDEAKAALLAHAADMNITEQRQRYAYSDGVNHGLRTEDFIYYLSGGRKLVDGNQWGDEGFTLYFSPPPGVARVVAMTRNLHNVPNPVTGEQYRDALSKKYGAPTQAASHALRWNFPAGRVGCIAGSGTYPLTAQKGILRYVFEGGVPSRFVVGQAKDLSDCASYLEYAVSLGASPAKFVTATMVDVEATARAELAANAWVAGLKAAAVKARESKGQGPKL
jgi:hypothetical protein